MNDHSKHVSNWDTIGEHIRGWIESSGISVPTHLQQRLRTNPISSIPKVMSDSVVALDHTDRRVRAGAIETLKEISRDEVLTILEASARFHPVRDTATQSMYALFSHSQQGARRAVEILLASPNSLASREDYFSWHPGTFDVSVKYVISMMVKHNLGSEYHQWLENVFRHSSSDSDAGYALTALAHTFGKDARPLVVEGLKMRGPHFDLGILNALKAIGYLQCADLLKLFLDRHVATASKNILSDCFGSCWDLYPDGCVSEGSGGSPLFIKLERELVEVSSPKLGEFLHQLRKEQESYYEAWRAADAAKFRASRSLN